MFHNVDEQVKRKWYVQGFNAVPIFLYGPLHSMFFDLPEMLGFGYTRCIKTFEKDVCHYLYDMEDLQAIAQELITRYTADPTYGASLLKTDKDVCHNHLNFLSSIDLDSVTATSDDELVSLWTTINNRYGKLLSVSHAVEGFTLTTEDGLREGIAQVFPTIPEALAILTTPPVPSYITIEQYKLANIAQEGLSKGIDAVMPAIEAHQRTYSWKLDNYTQSQVLDVAHFVKEVQGLMDDPDTLESFIQHVDSHKEQLHKRDKLMSQIVDKKLKALLELNHVMFEIHDRRKEHMVQTLRFLEAPLKELAKRAYISLRDATYCLPEEVAQLEEVADELHARRIGSVYVSSRKGTDIYIGDQAKKIIAQLLPPETLGEDGVITGHSASSGVVQGTVKVCRGLDQLEKVDMGDILVTAMTQPEFVPAMKLSAAVVTDEGGLTCHASIISRELGIPCVIGTKIATKVLKDGDVVEVDATKGIVRKI